MATVAHTTSPRMHHAHATASDIIQHSTTWLLLTACQGLLTGLNQFSLCPGFCCLAQAALFTSSFFFSCKLSVAAVGSSQPQDRHWCRFTHLLAPHRHLFKHNIDTPSARIKSAQPWCWERGFQFRCFLLHSQLFLCLQSVAKGQHYSRAQITPQCIQCVI